MSYHGIPQTWTGNNLYFDSTTGANPTMTTTTFNDWYNVYYSDEKLAESLRQLENKLKKEAKVQIYEVIFTETSGEKEKKTRIVYAAKSVLAKNRESAVIQASIEMAITLGEEEIKKFGEIEAKVKTFEG